MEGSKPALHLPFSFLFPSSTLCVSVRCLEFLSYLLHEHASYFMYGCFWELSRLRGWIRRAKNVTVVSESLRCVWLSMTPRTTAARLPCSSLSSRVSSKRWINMSSLGNGYIKISTINKVPQSQYNDVVFFFFLKFGKNGCRREGYLPKDRLAVDGWLSPHIYFLLLVLDSLHIWVKNLPFKYFITAIVGKLSWRPGRTQLVTTALKEVNSMGFGVVLARFHPSSCATYSLCKLRYLT